MTENCGNCAFGVTEQMHQSSRLNCHRHAPIVFVGVVGCRSRSLETGGSSCTVEDIMGPITAWPTVSQYYFCGDFELKDAS